MRPRMSRIFYQGKYYDYPLKAINALRNLGPIEAVRCVACYVWRPDPPAEGPGQTRGLGRARFGWRLYPTSSRPTPRSSGASRPASSRPTGPPSGSRASSLKNAIVNAVLAQAEPEGDHLPHRGVPVPQVRARDDVGGLPREGRGRRARRSTWRPGRARSATPTAAPTRSWPCTADGTEATFPGTEVISSMPISQLLEAMDPPPPAEVQAAADDLALPRLPHRRPGRARGVRLPRQLDLHPRPRGARSGASRTSAPGRRTWSRRGAPASASSTSCARATRSGPRPTRTSSSRPSGSSAARAWSTRPGRGRLRRAHAQGLPDLRRALPEQRRRAAALARADTPERPPGRAATACTATTTRTTRCSRPCSRVENIVAGTAHDVWEVNVEEEYHEEATSTSTGSTGARGTGRDAPVLPRRTSG